MNQIKYILTDEKSGGVVCSGISRPYISPVVGERIKFRRRNGVVHLSERRFGEFQFVILFDLTEARNFIANKNAIIKKTVNGNPYRPALKMEKVVVHKMSEGDYVANSSKRRIRRMFLLEKHVTKRTP